MGSRGRPDARSISCAACPTQLPTTPTGRLAALQSRLEAMLRAVDTVAPALNAFYQSLNDEQRARFDSVGQEQEDTTASVDQTKSRRPAAIALRSRLANRSDRAGGSTGRPPERGTRQSSNASHVRRRCSSQIAKPQPRSRPSAASKPCDSESEPCSTQSSWCDLRLTLSTAHSTTSSARFNMIGGQEAKAKH